MRTRPPNYKPAVKGREVSRTASHRLRYVEDNMTLMHVAMLHVGAFGCNVAMLVVHVQVVLGSRPEDRQ